MKPQEITRDPLDAVIALDAGEAVRVGTYGRRAAKLARLAALGLPVPPGVALSFDCVAALAAGAPMPPVPLPLAPGDLLALRSSPEERAWGGAQRAPQPRRLRAQPRDAVGPDRRARRAPAAPALHPDLCPRRARPRPGGLRGAGPPAAQERGGARRGGAQRPPRRHARLLRRRGRGPLARGSGRAARRRRPGDGARLERALRPHPAPGARRPGRCRPRPRRPADGARRRPRGQRLGPGPARRRQDRRAGLHRRVPPAGAGQRHPSRRPRRAPCR